MRGMEFEPFSFMINSEGFQNSNKPLPESTNKKSIEPYLFDKEMHKKILLKIYEKNSSFSRSDFYST